MLQKVISKHCSNLTIVGTANTIADGIDLIYFEEPDLVFLDINIKEREIFELLDYFNHPRFKIIFVSANEVYCDRCYSIGADFILKPFGMNDVISSVYVAVKSISEKKYNYNLKKEKRKIHQN
ncbi:response regulator [Flavobacterium sp. A45]|uniref:response regulator n=1 Tax=Flavobacterium sp. A45 TaxID=1945862 RepID=UPI00352EBEBB